MNALALAAILVLGLHRGKRLASGISLRGHGAPLRRGDQRASGLVTTTENQKAATASSPTTWVIQFWSGLKTTIAAGENKFDINIPK